MNARSRSLLGLGLVSLAVVVRYLGFDFLQDDLRTWVFPWYDHHLRNGFFGLGETPPNVWNTDGNYAPPYYYLLLLASKLHGVVPTLHLIKAIPSSFDFLAAYVVYRIAKRGAASPESAWIAFFSVLFAPTVVANGSLWGQCDVIPATLVAASVYCAIAGRPVVMAAFLGAALAVKGTPAFLLPFLLMLFLKGQVRWWVLGVLPLAYLAMMLPAIVAGRPIFELITIYLHQGDLYRHLSMNAPNLYYFVPDEYYDIGVRAGLIITAVASLVFAVAPVFRRATLSPQLLLVAATLSLALPPFLLAKMHDRYFFAVDVLSIALVWFDRRLWYIPVLSQASSVLAYVPILSEVFLGIDDGYRGLMPVAVLLNVALMAALSREYWRLLTPARRVDSETDVRLRIRATPP